LPGTANSKPSPPLAVAGFKKSVLMKIVAFQLSGSSEKTSPPGTTSEMKIVSSWFGFDSGFLFDTFFTKSWVGAGSTNIICDFELAIYFGALGHHVR